MAGVVQNLSETLSQSGKRVLDQSVATDNQPDAATVPPGKHAAVGSTVADKQEAFFAQHKDTDCIVLHITDPPNGGESGNDVGVGAGNWRFHQRVPIEELYRVLFETDECDDDDDYSSDNSSCEAPEWRAFHRDESFSIAYRVYRQIDPSFVEFVKEQIMDNELLEKHDFFVFQMAEFRRHAVAKLHQK